MSRDPIADVAALLHPLSQAPESVDPIQTDLMDAVHADVAADRARTAAALTAAWEESGADPVLTAIAAATAARAAAEAQVRLLLAYGRECTLPRPYTLAELGAAAGLSISGVRTGYDHHDVEQAATATGARPREWRASEDVDAPSGDELADLLADLAQRTPAVARHYVMDVYRILERAGWTPHPPTSRTVGIRSGRRYIRWTRTWPGGTTVTLYQENGWLGTSPKVDESDPRRFVESYIDNTPDEIATALATFTAHIHQVEGAPAHAAVPAVTVSAH